MKTFHVISVTLGTGLLLCFLTFCLAGAFVFSVMNVHVKPTAPFAPRTGAVEQVIETQLNELKYGPVNTAATKEVKNGLPLFDRIRANRQARVCVSHASHQAGCVASPVVYYPQAVVAVSPVVVPVMGIEMPAVTPDPIPAKPSECVDGKCPVKQSEAVKTGSFICSNCRKSQVGEWHTEWKSDGTPVTFLCERCHSFMSTDQREKAYIGYLSRQSKTAGIAGLLHQELGQ
jgi:hypothetical protein